MKITNLNGIWDLYRPATGEHFPASVPGVVHTDLLAAGVIERPHYRDNERKLAWIGLEDWIYAREFDLDGETLARRAHRLIFEGLDTFADVALNGVHLGATENMFRRYEFDVTGILRERGNKLRVAFASPQRKAGEIAAGLPVKIPYTGEKDWHITDTNRNLIRKCQCHGGWDWGPAFLTSGIWRDVTLVSFERIKIDDLKPLQFHDGKRVRVRTAIYLDIAQEGTYEVTAALAGQSVTESFKLSPGKSSVEIELELLDPELWWPAGYGEQKLHFLQVAVSADGRRIDERTVRIGLRRVELVREDDEHGQSFYFKVNGIPVFLKGYNWIPADSFTSRMSRSVYADLIDSAVAANCNTLRVWGGGIYENDDFYDLCDEKGILIWQDFMFACAMYPWDDAFLDNVAQEVVYQLRRLCRHPSILLWCGNNECELALTWYPETRSNPELFLQGYHKLYLETIGSIMQTEAPGVPYWPSSPSNGPGEYGDANDPGRGDTHYWEVWHGGKPFSEYLAVKPRMSSEYGFQSIPSLETLKTVLEPEDFNISSPMMDYRQRSAIGNKAIIEHMMSEYHLPATFEKLVYLSQVQQGMAMKIATEHWRRLMPINMGTIIWQLNDIWPGNSWSSIEHGGKWKVLHSMSKRFFAPTLLSVAKTPSGIEVWATSDRREDTAGGFFLEARDFSGEVLRRWQGAYALGPGQSRACMRLSYDELGELGALCQFFLVLLDNGGDRAVLNWEFLQPAKFCPLQKAEITLTTRDLGGKTEIILRTDRPAFHVWLEAPGRRGVFDDNAFLLLPDRPKRIVFSPKDGGEALEKENIRLIHLRDTY